MMIVVMTFMVGVFATEFWGDSRRCHAVVVSLGSTACLGAVPGRTSTRKDILMNNETIESVSATSRPGSPRESTADELTRVKREILKAEVKLAKARATVTTAEVDVKLLEARLRVLAK